MFAIPGIRACGREGRSRKFGESGAMIFIALRFKGVESAFVPNERENRERRPGRTPVASHFVTRGARQRTHVPIVFGCAAR